jgi:hypothetical protein
MTKDGIPDKVRDSLKRVYDRVAEEPTPDDLKELLAKLK